MSWYTSVAGVTSTEARAQIEAADIPHNDHADSESREQLAACKVAAIALVESGALGSGHFNVYLSGHANVEHLNTPGWSQDCVTVRVDRAPAS